MSTSTDYLDPFSMAATVDAESPEDCHRIGLWQMENGSPEVAVGWLMRACSLNPTSPTALISLGGAYMMLRCWNGAARAFKEAAELDPSSINAHFGYGSACAQMGKLPEAIAALETARSLQKA